MYRLHKATSDMMPILS